MRNPYFIWFKHLFLVCLALLFANSSLNAQLILERELIGAAAAVGTVVSNGGEQELQVDASFGESMIGYEEGDIIITVGFHQTATRRSERRLGDAVPEDEGTAKTTVNTYPNPTVEKLTVDLGDFSEKITELRLIDVYGRTVKYREVSGEQLITFRELNRLPNANYFLQGVDANGKLHQLATVLIVTY